MGEGERGEARSDFWGHGVYIPWGPIGLTPCMTLNWFNSLLSVPMIVRLEPPRVCSLVRAAGGWVDEALGSGGNGKRGEGGCGVEGLAGPRACVREGGSRQPIHTFLQVRYAQQIDKNVDRRTRYLAPSKSITVIRQSRHRYRPAVSHKDVPHCDICTRSLAE